jgi:pyruvate dehydrogenase E2 component (dihydrolipoamide acetyltransferase)
MSQAIEVKVPDIGDYKDIPVIEVLVKAGDTVEKEQSLVTLESDKATMDVPSSAAGTVKEVKVKVGDNVSEGSLIVVLEGAEGGADAAKPAAAQANGAAAAPAPAPAPAAAPAPAPTPAASGGGVQEVKVPDIGDYKDIPVIEIAVKVGDRVEKEQSLVTLESDKATMDVPSTAAGDRSRRRRGCPGSRTCGQARGRKAVRCAGYAEPGTGCAVRAGPGAAHPGGRGRCA